MILTGSTSQPSRASLWQRPMGAEVPRINTMLQFKPAAAVILLAAVASLAACGNGKADSAAKPKASRTMPAYCLDVLDAIPASPPANASAAGALTRAFSTDPGGVMTNLPHDSLLYSLSGAVGVDGLHLTFDMTGLSANTSNDLATYNADVAQIRSYCNG